MRQMIWIWSKMFFFANLKFFSLEYKSSSYFFLSLHVNLSLSLPLSLLLSLSLHSPSLCLSLSLLAIFDVRWVKDKKASRTRVFERERTKKLKMALITVFWEVKGEHPGGLWQKMNSAPHRVPTSKMACNKCNKISPSLLQVQVILKIVLSFQVRNIRNCDIPANDIWFNVSLNIKFHNRRFTPNFVQSIFHTQ